MQRIVSAVSQAVIALFGASQPTLLAPPSMEPEQREVPLVVGSDNTLNLADATTMHGPVASALHHITGETEFIKVSPSAGSGDPPNFAQLACPSVIFAIEKSWESEEINQLQKELSNEREKCKNLEADISILIRGRNKEVNELNNTIVSLENRLKSSEAMNESLRQLIMQMKNHAIIDETSITSIVHSIDNPLGSSSFSGVFNSDDQPDDLPLCIKNFTTIDEASITPEAHCIDNTLGSQSDDFLSGFENFTVADGVNIAIDQTDSSLNTSSSFKKQLKKYREKQSLAFPNRSHNWMKPVPTNPQTTELNTFNTNKRNQHLSRNTVRSRKNFKSKQTKPKRNFRKKLSLDRPPDWENYLDLVSKITRT
ncbi:Hypothetical predicted protein [Paramuricea clavata]|uniref:Uncharacterized protein n=1 Tax=Paramuricea clavata TaxID=317549 RepID=A0A6S7GCB5_PARCT|nr:Hypothetical predicted protein [Paramuricea clavata]